MRNVGVSLPVSRLSQSPRIPHRPSGPHAGQSVWGDEKAPSGRKLATPARRLTAIAFPPCGAPTRPGPGAVGASRAVWARLAGRRFPAGRFCTAGRRPWRPPRPEGERGGGWGGARARHVLQGVPGEIQHRHQRVRPVSAGPEHPPPRRGRGGPQAGGRGLGWGERLDPAAGPALGAAVPACSRRPVSVSGEGSGSVPAERRRGGPGQAGSCGCFRLVRVVNSNAWRCCPP